MRLRVFVEPQQGATYDQLLGVARAAEELGFDAFFRSDHFLTMGGDGLPGPTDAWITLAGIARETTTIRLGTLMTSATFRFPGPLAIAVAQVDAMSGGRIELGLGAGWYEEEHRAYGIPFPSLKERFDRLEEQLEVITGLWATPLGQRFVHEGRFYPIVDSPALPKPVQEPAPPVIVGGAGAARTPSLAARFADEFNLPFHRLDDTRLQFDRVRRACEAAGRDPGSLRLSVALVVCCGRDEAEIKRRAEAIGQAVDGLRENGLAGTPAEVLDKARQYEALGASSLYLQTLDLNDLDHLHLISEQVGPHLR